MKLADVLIDLAATKRLTRLIVKDEITRPLRDHPTTHSHAKLSYLLHCEICVSVYTSAIIAMSGILLPRVSKPIKYALALAEVQATLIELEAQRDALVQDYGPAFLQEN